MIGSGIFASPEIVYKQSGSVGMGLIIWVLCGLLAMCGAMCYAELGTSIKESGDENLYLVLAFGPLPSFSFDWTPILSVKPAGMAGITLACGSYILEAFVNEGDIKGWMVKLLTTFIISMSIL